MVIQLADSQQQSQLIAFDKVTGERLWQTSRESNGCWTTPVVAKVNNQWHLVVNGTGSSDGSSGFVQGYDIWSGRLLWKIPGTADIVCPTTIVGEDLLVSTSGSNGPVIAIEKDFSGNAATPTVRWETPTGGSYVPTGVLYRERLYVVDDDGILSCIDPTNGQQVWRERLRYSVSASLVAGANRVYVAGESGDVYVVAAKDEFELLATNSLHEATLATPAIAAGDIFIRTQSHLFCISEAAAQAEHSTDGQDQNSVGATINPIPSPSDVPTEPRPDGQG